MRERLWDVAEQLAGFRVDLLGEEADVVRERDRVVHERLSTLETPGPCESLHEPERTGEEGTFELLRTAVAVDERPLGELLLDGGDRAGHALASRIGEPVP